jgi:hypothetical protein
MVKGAITHMRATKTSHPVSHVWLDKSVGGVYTDDIITWLTGENKSNQDSAVVYIQMTSDFEYN